MQDNTSYQFSRTQEGDLTCSITKDGKKYWLHSRYNPLVEAQRFADSQIDAISSQVHTVIVYGIGCGHHIRALIERLASKDIKIQVWEANLPFLREALEHMDLRDLINNPLIEIVPIASPTELENRMLHWGDEGTALFIHQPSLYLIPSSLLQLQRALEEYQLFWLSVVSSHRQMIRNFELNLQRGLPGVERFAGLFAYTPIIMVAAGPSLQKNMMLLKQARRHSLIGAVGTAWQPLMDAGIVPDFVMMTDPNYPMREQIVGLEESKVPLFAMSTLYYEVLECYTGPSFLIFQKGYAEAENEARRTNNPLIETGGSVATSMHSLARLLEFSPICWVGLDLAYTQGLTHIPGAHRGREIQSQSEVSVMNWDKQGTVATSRNLRSYLRWFEGIASQSKVPLYNATEGGAYIQGFVHLTLQQFIVRVKEIDISSKRKLWQDITNMKEKV